MEDEWSSKVCVGGEEIMFVIRPSLLHGDV